jgi:hypothetical protein
LKGNYTNPVVVDFSKSVDVRPTIQRSATTVTRYADDSEQPLKAMRAIPTVDWYDQGTDASDGLPPPPAQLMDRRSDSDDDFPLPPPPDMDAVPVIAKSDVAPIGGIQLMHSLSVKLASRNSVASRAPPPVAAKTFRTSHVDRSASVDQATTDSPADGGQQQSAGTDTTRYVFTSSRHQRPVGASRSWQELAPFLDVYTVCVEIFSFFG